MYAKNTWQDRAVQFPKRYTLVNNGDGTYTIDSSPGTVTQIGTGVVAPKMNNLETGVEDAHNVKARTAATVKHGLNVLQCDVPGCPIHAFLYGRTLVNLLGKDGNFEVDSNTDGVADGWIGSLLSGATASLDTTSPKYGSKAQRITANTGDSSNNRLLYRNTPFNAGKYYVGLVDITTDTPTTPWRILAFDGSVSLAVVDGAGPKVGTIKFAPASDYSGGQMRLYNRIAVGSTGWVQFDGMRLYEVDAATYNKIDVDPEYTGDKLAEKFPYVDGIKHLTGPALQKAGKNLLPPFTEWTLHANAVVTEPYKLTLSATATDQRTTVRVPVLPSTTYTLGIQAIDANAKINYRELNAAGTYLTDQQGVLSTGLTKSITTRSDSAFIEFYTTNTSTGSFTFSNPQLELGSVATAFDPRNDDYAYLPITLASNVDGSARDEAFWRDGAWRKLKRWQTDVVLDGSLAWAFQDDRVGLKRIAVPNSSIGSSFGPTSLNYIAKYNGLVIGSGDTTTLADQKTVSSGNLILSIADADSGWTESINPNSNAVKALANGWKANGNNGTVYNSWVSVLDGSVPATNTEAYVAANKAPGWTGWATMSYQLAAAVEEVIAGAEGAISTHQGGNQVELFEGVIVREKVTPYDRGDTWIFITDSRYPSSQLKYRNERIIAVYKNGVKDNTWVIDTATPYGKQKPYNRSATYDPTAEYTVTYVMLDKYLATINAVDASAEIESNPAGAQAASSRAIADMVTALNILQNASVLLSKLKTVDGVGSGLDAEFLAGMQVRWNSSSKIYEVFDGGVWSPMGGIKSVQRGKTTNTASLVNVTISSVNMAKAFVSSSVTTQSTGNVSAGTAAVRLTSSTNLEIDFGQNAATSQAAWEVVELY